MTDAEALEWALALKSGEYTQDTKTGYLTTRVFNSKQPVCYCCLGVEQVIHNVECEVTSMLCDYEINSRRGDNAATRFKRLPAELQMQFTRWNDSDELTFSEIADKIIEGFNLTT